MKTLFRTCLALLLLGVLVGAAAGSVVMGLFWSILAIAAILIFWGD